MDNNKKKIIKISDYYKDFDLPNSCLSNDSFRNLLELSANNDINILDKSKKEKPKIKSKKKIINQCEKLKKIKIKELTKELNKYNTNIESKKIRETNDKYVDNLESIDSLMNIISNDNDIDKLNKLLSDSDDFIEKFSN